MAKATVKLYSRNAYTYRQSCLWSTKLQYVVLYTASIALRQKAPGCQLDLKFPWCFGSRFAIYRVIKKCSVLTLASYNSALRAPKELTKILNKTRLMGKFAQALLKYFVGTFIAKLCWCLLSLSPRRNGACARGNIAH